MASAIFAQSAVALVSTWQGPLTVAASQLSDACASTVLSDVTEGMQFRAMLLGCQHRIIFLSGSPAAGFHVEQTPIKVSPNVGGDDLGSALAADSTGTYLFIGYPYHGEIWKRTNAGVYRRIATVRGPTTNERLLNDNGAIGLAAHAGRWVFAVAGVAGIHAVQNFGADAGKLHLIYPSTEARDLLNQTQLYWPSTGGPSLLTFGTNDSRPSVGSYELGTYARGRWRGLRAIASESTKGSFSTGWSGVVQSGSTVGLLVTGNKGSNELLLLSGGHIDRVPVPYRGEIDGLTTDAGQFTIVGRKVASAYLAAYTAGSWTEVPVPLISQQSSRVVGWMTTPNGEAVYEQAASGPLYVYYQ